MIVLWWEADLQGKAKGRAGTAWRASGVLQKERGQRARRARTEGGKKPGKKEKRMTRNKYGGGKIKGRGGGSKNGTSEFGPNVGLIPRTDKKKKAKDLQKKKAARIKDGKGKRLSICYSDGI